MLVPKRHIGSLAEATPADADVLGRMMSLAGRLAREQGSPDGFRTIVNTGRIGRQDVMHVHLHVIGGPDPLGPMPPRGAAGTVRGENHGGFGCLALGVVRAPRRAVLRTEEP